MRISTRKLLTYIFCFIILVYPFNYTIKSRLFPNNILIFITIGISFVGLLLLSKIKKMTNFQIITLIITVIIFGMQLFNNYYFKENSEGKVILFSLYLFLPFILLSNKEAIKCFVKIIPIFCFEHILGTFFVQVFRTFFMNNILPWLSKGAISVAYYNLRNGYNSGLTLHYSTNGIYLSIATLFFFTRFLASNQKSKKYFIFTILSALALLLTGKRAHTLFSIMSCIIVFILNSREKFSKRIIKFFIGILLFILIIFVASMFIPEVLNVINRFEETSSKGELLSGREPFYELALKLWRKNKMFGNGWGAFSYEFQTTIFITGHFTYGYLDAHNVYLQLLCECGILGFLFLTIIEVYILVQTSKCIAKSNEKYFILIFSLAFQIFFLLYCFSGNPLYDIQCYSVYFICIGITLNCKIENLLDKKGKVKNEQLRKS